MAISVPAAGTWATLTADGAVTIPGSPGAGTRMLLFAAWKDFAITAQVTSPQAWTEITEVADGSVNQGNGTGSMKVGAWYRDWQSGDGNPTLDFSSSPNIAGAVIILLSKGAGETWDAPTFVTAAIAAATPFSATSSSAITIKSGAIVLELVGLRDDSTGLTRSATTAVEDDGSPNVTWNGNVVETVAGHLTTTSANDMAADLIHRLVTTGAAGVNLTATGTPDAAETGSVLWVHQGVSTPTTVSPAAASLAATGAAPTVTATLNQRVTPPPASLAATGAAPTVAAPRVVRPAAASLTATGAVPTASAPRVARPNAATLAATGAAPSVATPRLVSPGSAALTATGAAPAVAAPRLVSPAAASLATTGSSPAVATTANQVARPSAPALAATGAAPTITTPIAVEAGSASLALAGAVPAIQTPLLTQPGAASLALAAAAPSVSTPRLIGPLAAALAASGAAPDVATPRIVGPDSAALATAAAAPSVLVSIRADPDAAQVAIVGAEPTVSSGLYIRPDAPVLEIEGFAPIVTTPRLVEVAAAVLAMLAAAPSVDVPRLVRPAAAALGLASAAPDVQAGSGVVVVPGPLWLTLTGFAPLAIGIVTVNAGPPVSAVVSLASRLRGAVTVRRLAQASVELDPTIQGEVTRDD